MRGLWIIALCVLVLPSVSAELLFTQPEAAYNFGDDLRMTLTLRPASDVTDFAEIDLRCGSQSVSLYRSLLTVAADASHPLVLTPRLDSPLFYSLNGTCEFVGRFGGEEVSSQSFVLTNALSMSVSVSTTLVSPGETIRISGSVHKANGAPLDGFVRIALGTRNQSVTQVVRSGLFDMNITLPARTPPGEQLLFVESYEKNNEEVVINRGVSESPLIVRAVLSRTDIVLSQPDVVPGNELTYTFYAYDQVDNLIEHEVHYELYEPNAEQPLITRLSATGARDSFAVNTSSLPGYWKIEATIGTFVTRKLFYVSELELVAFNVENNNTLVVTNVGNVPYRHHLEIVIGNYSSIHDISLAVGASRQFRLKAPEAVYEVKVREGNRTFLSSTLPLTGRAISVGEVGGSFFNLWWAGLFIMVLVGVTFVTNIYIARRRSGRGFGLNRETRETPRTAQRIFSGAPVSATSAVTGKEQATMIALRTDGSRAGVQNSVESALRIAKSAGAHITREGNYHMITFSSRFTRKLENDMLAVQIAKEMESSLKGSDFGMGVSKGEIIADSRTPGQFTSLGSFVPSTKRLANSSSSDVLVSEEIRAALRTQVKAEKVAGTQGWRVSSVVNREGHKGFITSFLKRTK